jgi:hypothetical protein
MQGVSPGCVLTPAEREFSMEPYDTVMSTFTQYADLAVQFGYATLFAGRRYDNQKWSDDQSDRESIDFCYA